MSTRQVEKVTSTVRPRRTTRARNEISDEMRHEIREAFDLFDNDHSGKIDFHECRVAMRALGFDVKKDEIQRIITDYDRDQSGSINFADFEEVMIEKIASRDPTEEIMKAFRLFDDDNTGRISLKNLRRVAKELGENISDEELAAMIDEFDRDGDQEIDEQDFIAILKSTSAFL